MSMLVTCNPCSWKLTGETNSTTPHVDILWLTGKVMEHTLLDTRPQKLIGVVMTLMDLITLHPCPSSILMTYWGRPFLLPMDENGERKRATISEHVKDLCQQQVSREDQLRVKLKIDGDQLADLISYNQLMEYLEDKTDTGPLEDGLYRFKCIKDHKGPYTSSDPEYNGSSYNLLIDWEPGEQTWEPLSNIIEVIHSHVQSMLRLMTYSTPQDKPGLQEHISMDGKSQETMHMHHNLIYTMITTSGRKLLIWKLSKSKNIKFSQMLEMHTSKHSKGRNYTLWVVLNFD